MGVTDDQLEQDLDAAREAVVLVEGTRAKLRRTTLPGDESRERQLDAARRQLDEVMRPLRRRIGQLVWDPIPSRQERALRDVSKSIQRERRRIKKMQRA